MRYLRLCSSFLLLMVCFNLIHAQPRESARMRKGDEAYQNMAYPEAIKYYEKEVAKGFNKNALLRLADSYRLTHNYKKAAEIYGKVVKLNQIDPLNYFYYAQSLMNIGQYSDAAIWFDKYAKAVPKDQRGAKFANSARNIESFYADSAGVRLRPFPHNTPVDEFSPTWYRDGIIFSSSRGDGDMVKREYDWNEQPFLDLYFSKVSDKGDKFGRPALVKGKLNTRFHEATCAYDSTNKLIYFTRNNFFEGKKAADASGVLNLKLFYADVPASGPWTNVRSLPFNSDHYSVGHPAIMPGGDAIVFISDMPGGYGGTDLYISQRKGDGWLDPVNLGPDLNTSGNEMFPYVTADKTLYYSSDGLGGLGGLDVFSCQLEGGTCKPRNVGAPINSSADDFGMIMAAEGSWGMFSSNREGGAGSDDIYLFHFERPVWNAVVLDATTRKPIENARVTVHPKDQDRPQSGTTNERGNVSMMLKKQSDYQVVIEAPQYRILRAPTTTKGIADGEQAQDTFLLEHGSLLVITRILDPATGYPIRNAKVKVVGTDLTFVTDSTGTASFYWDPYPEYSQKPFDCPPEKEEEYCFRFTDEGFMDFDTLKLVYEWSFGDGTKGQGLEVRHCYAKPGTYPVELNLLDPTNGSLFMNQATYDLEVRPTIGLHITGPDTLTRGTKANYDALSSILEGCDLSNFQWQLEGQDPLFGSKITLSFDKPGTYSLKLNAGGTDAGGSPKACGACIIKSIVVLEPGWQQRIDSVGTVALHDRPVGSILLEIDKLGYEKKRVSFDPGKEEGVSIDSFYLDKVGNMNLLRVIVKDEFGNPLKGTTTIVLKDAQTGEPIGTYQVKEGWLELPMEPERSYVVVASKEGYLTEQERVGPLKVGNNTVEVVFNLKQIAIGKSWVLKNLYYDFDKSHIRHDAAIQLLKLRDFLSLNPNLRVELGSHTDCRGSDSYNKTLAGARAESAVHFLIELGISPQKIVAHGYGEEHHVNGCRNGVACDEIAHQANRRTEITIIGFSEPIYSQATKVEDIWGIDGYIDASKRNNGPSKVMIQLGMFEAPQPVNTFSALDGSRFRVIESKTPYGYAYTCGTYDSYQAANADLKQVIAKGFNGAIITADSKPITVTPLSYFAKPDPKADPKASFSVQVGVFGRSVQGNFMNSFGDYSAQLFEEKWSGMRVFFVGHYATYEEAEKHKAKMQRTGHPDAFVVQFEGGKKVNLDNRRAH